MPKTEKGEPAKPEPPPVAATKKSVSEARREELQRKLERLNRETEMLGDAMRTKKS